MVCKSLHGDICYSSLSASLTASFLLDVVKNCFGVWDSAVVALLVQLFEVFSPLAALPFSNGVDLHLVSLKNVFDGSGCSFSCSIRL